MNMLVKPAANFACSDPIATMDRTVETLKTYLQANPVAPADLPTLIRGIFAAFSAPASAIGFVPVEMVVSEDAPAEVSSDAPSQEDSATAEADEASQEDAPTAGADEVPADRFSAISKVPVIPVAKSIQNDGLVCLIDGVKKLMLKRHLRARYGMEWEEYVAHFSLPSDYPSAAPGYSKEKSRYAKKVGFGSLIDKTPRTERGLPPKRKGGTVDTEIRVAA